MGDVPARKHVVIVGGGFAGLEAARGLAREDVDLTLVDRKNHHTFQPLLYQVATAGLSPAEIASPIRRILRRQRNARVLLGEVSAVDPEARRLRFDGAELGYDFLILAAGATHSYFGHGDWEPHAPGLKTIEDALEIRRRALVAFEQAEREEDDGLPHSVQHEAVGEQRIDDLLRRGDAPAHERVPQRHGHLRVERRQRELALFRFGERGA